jgi:hypothetical protein
VSNAIVRKAKELRSVVDRPFYRSAPYDLSIDPTKPDPHDCRDYVGNRANPTVSDDPEDDAAGTRAAFSRLRPPPKELEIIFGDPPRCFHKPWRKGLMSLERAVLSLEESHVIEGRMRGLTLKELASDLGLSVATAW